MACVTSTTSVPAPTRSATAREWGVDLARGVAVIGMFVAHTAPGAGPADILMVSEYFPFPLFALLMGAGAELVARRMAVVRHAGESLVRAVILVFLGWALTQAGAQVLVVLAPLGIFAALAWLVSRLPSVVLVLGAGAGIAVTPWTVRMTEQTWREAQWGMSDVPVVLADALLNPYYPIAYVFAAAALGVVFVRFTLPAQGERPSRLLRIMLGVACLAASAAVLVAGRAGLVEIGANKTTVLILSMQVVMAIGVAFWCMVLVEVVPALVLPVAHVGAMAFTVYSLHILWLALWVEVLFPGESDDTWVNVVGMTVVALALAVVWQAMKIPGRWWRGPLEGVVGVMCAFVGRRLDRATSAD